MKQKANDLQRLKGIGKVIARRLKDAGLKDFAGIVQEGEEGLKSIAGIRPRDIPSILAQAKELSEGKKAQRSERIETIRKRVTTVRERVNAVAAATRERPGAELDGSCGSKLEGALEGVIGVLDRLDDDALKRLKRAERGLDKTEKRMEGLEGAGLRKVRKGLKKSRKALQKALT